MGHRSTTRTVSNYEDENGLFVAATIVKNDDINDILSISSKDTINHVVDVCGGYGRARIHWGRAVPEWCVVDQSAQMIKFGNHLANAYGIEGCRYILGSVELFPKQYFQKFDAALCLYNSINEITRLDKFFRSLSFVMKPGSKLYIRYIILDDRSRLETFTDLGCFLSFQGKIWYVTTLSVRKNERSSIQKVDIRFRSHSGNQTVRYLLHRRIWKRAELDRAARDNSFSTVHHSLSSNYLIYSKNG